MTAATQWRVAHQTMLVDLAEIDQQRVTSVRYESLLDDPQSVIEALCDFAGIAREMIGQRAG